MLCRQLNSSCADHYDICQMEITQQTWLTWYWQCEGFTPLCWRIWVISASTLTHVVSTAGLRNSECHIIIVCPLCGCAGSSPFILPLSGFTSFLHLTCQSDRLTSEYLRPVGLLFYNNFIGNCLHILTVEIQIETWNQHRKLNIVCLIIMSECIFQTKLLNSQVISMVTSSLISV